LPQNSQQTQKIQFLLPKSSSSFGSFYHSFTHKELCDINYHIQTVKGFIAEGAGTVTQLNILTPSDFEM
jgi:hypothetical protein